MQEGIQFEGRRAKDGGVSHIDLSREFLRRKFREYYLKAELYIPMEFSRREWAFVPIDSFPDFVMNRHISFSSYEELKRYVVSKTPMHAYYSSAYYSDPSAEMDRKGWMGADLIFDIDADHMPKRSLKAAKMEVFKLVKILTDDFGIDERDLEVVFSGHRGYHVHVYDESLRGLDPSERREIADYLTLKGLKPGWSTQGQRVERCMERLNKGFEECVKLIAVHIDPPVTADVKRLIRLPNSIHGKTGFRVTVVDLDKLEGFDPLVDAVVFGEERVKITLLKRIKLKIMNEGFRLEPGRHVVPEYLAVFLICRGVAWYGH